MPYCQLTHVVANNQNRTYSGTSKPTSMQVKLFINQIDNEINNLLTSKGIATPVAGNDFLQMLCALGAAALAEASINPETGKKKMELYNMKFKQLSNNPQLSGVSPGSTSSDNRSDFTSNFNEKNSDRMNFSNSGGDW